MKRGFILLLLFACRGQPEVVLNGRVLNLTEEVPSPVGAIVFIKDNIQSLCTIQKVGYDSIAVTAAHCFTGDIQMILWGYNPQDGSYSHITLPNDIGRVIKGCEVYSPTMCGLKDFAVIEIKGSTKALPYWKVGKFEEGEASFWGYSTYPNKPHFISKYLYELETTFFAGIYLPSKGVFNIKSNNQQDKISHGDSGGGFIKDGAIVGIASCLSPVSQMLGKDPWAYLDDFVELVLIIPIEEFEGVIHDLGKD